MGDVERLPASKKQMAFGVWGKDEALSLGMEALKKFQDSDKYGMRKEAGHRSLHLELCKAYVENRVEGI